MKRFLTITPFLMLLLFSLNLMVLAQVQPAFLSQEWVNTGGPVGGIGYDIRYNYDNPDIWYVTDGFSGMHISMDNGETWQPSNNGIAYVFDSWSISAFCTTVDPHNPNIVWAGTQFTGIIYKSVDGGQSWMETRNGIDPQLTELSFRGFTIDPRTSDIVYAMGEVGSNAWNEEPKSIRGFDLSKGVVYKTLDGGKTWTEIWRGDNLARYCWIRPDDPDVLFVSTGIFDRHAANADEATNFPGGVGILKSTNGGNSWTVLNEANGLDNLYLGSLYMHPENPDIMLACAGSDLWLELNEAVYLTEDGGESWSIVIDEEELFGAVEFSETDPNIAYAASPNAFYRSEDGGHTWQRFSRSDNSWGPPGFVIGFPIDIQCDPRDASRIFVNSYLGGNFLSVDGGESWHISSKGYSGANIHRIEIMPGLTHNAYVGSRSGIFRTDNGGDFWEGICYNPPEMSAKLNELQALAVNPINPEHVICVAADYPYILYSYNGGFTWNSGTMIEVAGIIIAFSSDNPDIVYTSSKGGFYFSDDGGENFIKKDHPVLDDNFTVMVPHPEMSQVVYAAKPDGTLWITDDSGTDWISIGTGLPSFPYKMIALAIDLLEPHVLYAGFSNENFQGVGVYKSIDGGETWFQTSVGMDPNTMINSIEVDPTNSNIVYAAGLRAGLYYSFDAGTTWQEKNNGLTNRDIKDMDLSDDGSVLYAGTNGAGVFRLGDLDLTSIVNLEILSENTELTLFKNIPNPFTSVTHFLYSINTPGYVTMDVYDQLGKLVVNLESGKKNAGSYYLRWNASVFPGGVYYVVLRKGRIANGIKIIYQK